MGREVRGGGGHPPTRRPGGLVPRRHLQGVRFQGFRGWGSGLRGEHTRFSIPSSMKCVVEWVCCVPLAGSFLEAQRLLHHPTQGSTVYLGPASRVIKESNKEEREGCSDAGRPCTVGEGGSTPPVVPATPEPGESHEVFISQRVFIMSFRKSRLPHKSVDSFFMFVVIKDKLTDLCGNELLQNNFINTLCSIGLTAIVSRSIVQGFLLRCSSCSVSWTFSHGRSSQAECTIPPRHTSGKHER